MGINFSKHRLNIFIIWLLKRTLVEQAEAQLHEIFSPIISQLTKYQAKLSLKENLSKQKTHMYVTTCVFSDLWPNAFSLELL